MLKGTTATTFQTNRADRSAAKCAQSLDGVHITSQAYTSVNYPEPTLLLNGTPVPVVQETKFLGVVFDRKLSFIPHIKHLKDKCTKALNLLRVLAHTSWGADQETLLHLYRSLIRSKLDYGWIVYLSARGSYLRMLDSIQNHALRLCLGAYRTSRIQFMHGSK